MITFSRSGVTVLAVSRTGVTLGTFFDSLYERNSLSRGRRYFDGMWGPQGFEVWAGRRHLIVECPPVARLLKRGGGSVPTAA